MRPIVGGPGRIRHHWRGRSTRQKTEAVRVLTELGVDRGAARARHVGCQMFSGSRAGITTCTAKAITACTIAPRRRLLDAASGDRARTTSTRRSSAASSSTCSSSSPSGPRRRREPGGARGWPPLLYLAFTRFTHAPHNRATPSSYRASAARSRSRSQRLLQGRRRELHGARRRGRRGRAGLAAAAARARRSFSCCSSAARSRSTSRCYTTRTSAAT